jgi:hypothetical protein
MQFEKLGLAIEVACELQIRLVSSRATADDRWTLLEYDRLSISDSKS